MKNQILIIFSAILITACVGLVIPIAASGNVTGLEVDKEQLKSNGLNQYKEEMSRLVDADYDKRVSVEMETQVAAGREQLTTETGGDKANPAGLPEGVNRIYADASSAERAKATVLTEMAAVDAGESKPTEPDPNLDEDTVLSSYVDTVYLSGLAGGGLTPQEDTDLQAYLKTRFLPDDYELAKVVNYDYAKLITE